jgi:hypothetical protein
MWNKKNKTNNKTSMSEDLETMLEHEVMGLLKKTVWQLNRSHHMAHHLHS